MLFDHPALLYGVLFVGVLLFFESTYQLIADARSGPKAQINRRMQMLASGRHPREVLTSLRRDLRDARGISRILPGLQRLERLLVQSGVSASASRALLWMVLVGGFAFFSLRLLSALPALPATAIAAAAGVALPILYLLSRKRRRLRLFEAQLPGALDLLVRSLRVGHPINSALAVVAQEMPDPIGSEFGIVVDEITYGQELDQALERMNERIDLQDLRYLTVAVQIQHASGGNLAEVLNGLSKVIRDRFQMFRKIHAITAEGRWSSWFLSLFPIVMVFAVQVVKPDYYSKVADHPLFSTLAAVTVVLLVLNLVFMRVLTKIKV
ncbi:MAG: type II secretion system F family protein [Geminicoccaceae bacterium]